MTNPLKINDVWELEGFVKQSNAQAGNNYGFIGLGQGGSKIVDTFAAIRSPKNGAPIYKCLIVNSNLGDMVSLKNIPKRLQFPLIGYEKGVGKNPEVGKTAFEENGEKIFESISQELQDCDMIYIVAAFGGGTGTGAINPLVEAIAHFMGKPVAAITTLPRPDEVESLNAYNAMAELVPKLRELNQDEATGAQYRTLENVIILDNDKIVQEHTTDPEVDDMTWDHYSNCKVASIMHEWNVLTSLDSEITLDAADLNNHVLKTGGILTFAKKKIDLEKINSAGANAQTLKEDLIQEIISTYRGKNVLANGFDYEKDMLSMALVVVMPPEMNMLNQDTLEIIRSRMKQELPNIGFYPGFVNSSSKRYAIVYTMASMGGLPERAKNLRAEAEQLIKLRRAKEEAASGFEMGEKLSVDRPGAALHRRSGTNPFGQPKAAAEQPTKPTKLGSNPFKKN